MQAKFKYVPGGVVKETLVNFVGGCFKVTLRNNCHLVKLGNIKKSPIIGAKVILVSGNDKRFSIKDDKLVIEIDHWGSYTPSYIEHKRKLMEAKEELPSLLKQLPAWFARDRVDLLTGKPLDNFSLEYEFTDLVETPKQIETKTPAWVYFHCDLPVITEPVQVGNLEIDPDWLTDSTVERKVWTFGRLGWIQVPSDLDWTPEEIETAFCNLARALLEKGTITVKIWNFKQTTQIEIE